MRKEEFKKMYELEDSHWWFMAKRYFISQVIPKSKNIKILDVGAGTGGTTKFLRRYGKVVGLEPSQLARNLARKKGFKFLTGSAEKLPLEAKSFDLICLFDVLYHKGVKNDLKALNEAYRVLKSKGHLIITDSALKFIKGPHDSALHARIRYSKKELTQKVEAAGFRVEKASYIFFFVFPVTLVKRLLSKLAAKSNVRLYESDVKKLPYFLNRLLINICALEARLLKLIDFPWGSSVIIRARKP